MAGRFLQGRFLSGRPTKCVHIFVFRCGPGSPVRMHISLLLIGYRRGCRFQRKCDLMADGHLYVNYICTGPSEIIKRECSSQMLSLLLQKQRRHVKQQTQAWHRARHSEVTVALLIGPPETLRSCWPMLGETTPKNHSAVKKVVPKIKTL